MSVKLINGDTVQPIVRKYHFTDVDLNVRSIELSVDDGDDKLVQFLKSKKICCYMCVTDSGEHFYIKNEYNRYFDLAQDSPGYRGRDWKWKKVNKKVFDLYNQYLTTRNRKFLSAAERI